jgi:hypothetical protein
MRFVFNGVLSQIQKAALRYNGAAQFLPAAAAVASLGRAYPEALTALDRFDLEKILESEARAASLSELAIREDEDVEALRRGRAEREAAMAGEARRREEEALVAQNFDKLNQGVRPGSALEEMAASYEGGE